jgi:hypothetical protein
MQSVLISFGLRMSLMSVEEDLFLQISYSCHTNDGSLELIHQQPARIGHSITLKSKFPTKNEKVPNHDRIVFKQKNGKKCLLKDWKNA